MKTILTFVIFCLLGCSVYAQQPNIILVEFDDMNDYTEQLGGQPQVETPTLSAMAELGTSFINAYCSAPQCGPSRTSMITGKDCDYTLVYNNPDYKCKDFRSMFKVAYGNQTVYTLPQWLKDSVGYFTYSLNKIMHCHDKLSDWDTSMVDACEKQQSWNKVFYYDDSIFIETIGDATLEGPDHFRWSLINDTLEPYMEDYVMVDSAISFIDAYATDPSIACNRPFFLGVGFDRPHLPYFIPEKYYGDHYLHDYYAEPYVLPYNDPVGHYPYNGVVMPPQPPVPFSDYYALNPDGVAESFVDPATFTNLLKYAEEEIDPFPTIDPLLTDDERLAILEQSVYANAVMAYIATIKYADAQFGRLMDFLETHPEIYNNTIIVITSDHGFSLGEKKHMLKGALWETDTRIPLLIVDLRNPIPVVSQQTASHLDVFPTVLDLIGAPKPHFPDGSLYLDGISLAPVVQGAPVLYERPALTTYVEKDVADQGGCFPNYSVRDERFHYIKYRTNNVYGVLDCDYASSIVEEELYDIGVNRETDPNEWNNLIADTNYAPVVEYLQQFLPDSNLFMSKTMKAVMQIDGAECLAGYDDTLHLSFAWSDTSGLPAIFDPMYTAKWTCNVIPGAWTGADLTLPISWLDAAAYDTTDRIMLYLQVYDTADALVAFDTRFVTLHPEAAPEATIDLYAAGPFVAGIDTMIIDGPYNYFWWDLGNGPCCINTVPTEIDFASPGTYTITLYVQYGLDSSCVATFTETYTTDIYHYFDDQIILLYPIPSRDFLHMESRTMALDGEVVIYDMSGKRVMECSVLGDEANGVDLNVGALPDGVYILNYRSLHAGTSSKFIKASD